MVDWTVPETVIVKAMLSNSSDDLIQMVHIVKMNREPLCVIIQE